MITTQKVLQGVFLPFEGLFSFKTIYVLSCIDSITSVKFVFVFSFSYISDNGFTPKCSNKIFSASVFHNPL